MTRVTDCANRAIAGLRRLLDRSRRVPPADNREPAAVSNGLDAEPLDVIPRIAKGGRIRHGRPRTDDAEIVADDIGNRETHGRTGRRRGQPSAFDRRQVLAHRIQRGDIGAALQQRVDGDTLVLERQRRRPEPPSAPTRRRTAARPASRPASCARATSSARRPAATLRSSGSGWLDGIHVKLPRQLDRQVRADDDAARGCDRRRCAQTPRAMNGAALPTAMTRRALPSQARRDCGILNGAVDQMMRGRGLNRAARNGQNVLAKDGQTEISVNVLRIGPARQARHDVELPQQAADDLVGVFLWLRDVRAGK